MCNFIKEKRWHEIVYSTCDFTNPWVKESHVQPMVSVEKSQVAISQLASDSSRATVDQKINFHYIYFHKYLIKKYHYEKKKIFNRHNAYGDMDQHSP